MTILYKVAGIQSNNSQLFFNNKLISKISSRNIIAFNQLLTDGYFFESIIYVCDIISPWECFRVCKSKNKVNVIEWNQSGDTLIIVYDGGDIEVWRSLLYSLNSWQLLCKTSMDGQNVIGAGFIHSGKCVYFNSFKKDLGPFAICEKLNFTPTLTNFGSSPLEGFIAISFTGFVGAYYFQKYLGSNDLASGSCLTIRSAFQVLGSPPDLISNCHIYNSLNGTINVALVYKIRSHAVNCYSLKLNVDYDENLQIHCQKMPQIILGHRKKIKIVQVRWLMINSEEYIIVAYHSNEGSFIEQWMLAKKHQPVHGIFKKSADFFPYHSWSSVAKVPLRTKVKDLCVSSFPSDYFPIHLILADNTIQTFECGLNGLNYFVLDSSNEDCPAGYEIISGDVSALNQILILLDNFGQLYAVQLCPTFHDKNYKPNNLNLLVALLEYAIIAGVDASDVLLTNITFLDLLIDKVTDSFTRQQPYAKQYYYSSFLSLKSNFCRVQTKKHDFDDLIHLHSISITFKSLLRPSDLSSQEKGPAENLTMMLNEYIPDVDKVLCNLDAKDFTVEPTTLQSLQQLIQWVSDLAIAMLNKLPEDIIKSKANKNLGYDISRDMVAISTIREIIVIIRIWGLLNSLCLPVYTKSVENVDVLAILFRILTRLAQNSGEPDEILLDDCNQLSSQVLIPYNPSKLPTTILNSNCLSLKLCPLIFTCSKEPASCQEFEMEKVIFSRDIKDGMTNLHLGTKCSSKRQCLRCGSINSVNKMEKTSAMKVWCTRWQHCHCGGFWKNVFEDQ